VKITGGLGNQLFQYSFGKHLAQKLNTKVLFDIQTNKSFKDFTPRKIELTFFECQIEIVSKKDKKKMKFFSYGIMERIERTIAKKYPHYFKTYFVEQATHEILNSNQLKDNCYFDGYWQSYKYLVPIESILHNELKLKYPLQLKMNDFLNEITNSQSVSIHIRRSDYITIKQNFDRFGICSKKYYENAILYIKKYFADPIFYIFSDDLDWVKENFIGSQYIFITDNKPAEDLYLMSKCKHNIIANSTFSWWGAWLNQNPEKIVIAPKQWYKGKLNETLKDLIPPEWIRI
jgi:hypothetical protein